MVGKSAARRLGAKAAAARSAGTGPSRGRLVTGVAKTLGDPKKTKRLLIVGQIVAPILAPVALQLADRRMRLLADRQRAKQLGVPVDDVALYRGPTGPVRARLDAVAAAVRELRDRRSGDAEVTAFAEKTMRR